jgi:nitrate reductase NapAB chaperone NapD
MIASLVAVLDSEHGLGMRSLAELAERNPCIELGVRHQTKIPLVVETEIVDELSTLTREIADLPGILHVDVVFCSVEK